MDVEGDALTFTVVSEEPLTSGIIDENVIQLNAPQDFFGENIRITLTAEEAGGGLQTEDEFFVTITPVNDPPRMTGEGIPDQEFAEDSGPWQIVDLDDVFFDVENDELEYAGISEDPVEIEIVDGHILTVTVPVHFNSDNIVINISAIEVDQGLEINTEFNLRITPENDPPFLIEDIPDQNYEENTGPWAEIDLDDYFEEVDGDDLLYSADPAEPLQVDIDDENILIISTPDDFYDENLPVTVTVTETGAGLEISNEFLVTVFPNGAPHLIGDGIPDQVYEEDSGPWANIDLDDYFFDVDGDHLSYFVDAADQLEIEIDQDNVLGISVEDDFFGDDLLVTVTAEESGEGLRREEEFIVTITPVNDGPRLIGEGIEAQVVEEDSGPWELFDLDDFFYDVEDDRISYQVESPEPITSEIIENNVLFLQTPDNYYSDEVTITIIAEELGGNLTLQHEFLFTITPINDAPEIAGDGIRDQAFDEDTGPWDVADLDDVFTDVEEDQLLFIVDVPEPIEASLNDESHLSISSPLDFYADDLLIAVTADEVESDLSVTLEFYLTITPINDPPRLSGEGFEDQQFVEDEGPWDIGDLDDIFFDPDGDVIIYSIETDDPLEGHIDGNNRLTLSLPDDVIIEDIPVTITAEEQGGGLQETTLFTVTVSPINDAPRVIGDGIIDQIFDEDTGPWDIADLDEVFMDIEGDELRYDIDVPEPIEASIDENNQLNLSSPLDYFADDQLILVTANEVGSELSVELEFVLTINPINDPPRLSGEGIEDQQFVEDEGPWDIGDLDDIFLEPDGDAILYSVEAGDPLEGHIDENNRLFLSLPNDANVEGAQVTVTAEEQGGGLQETTQFAVIVSPVNDVPRVVGDGISNQVFDEDSGPWEIGDLDDVFTDIEGDELQYNIEVPEPIEASLDDDNQLILSAPLDFFANDLLIIVTASEVESELSVSNEFKLIINPVNDPPRLTGEGIEDQEYIEDQGPWEVVALDDVFYDPDGDDISYSVEPTDPLEGFIDNNNILTLNLPDDLNVNGVLVTVTAEEQGGRLQVVTEFSVTVLPVNDRPRVVGNGIEDQVFSEDTGPWDIVDLDDIFFDIEENELQYSIEVPEPIESSLHDNNLLSLSAPLDFFGDNLLITIIASEVESELSVPTDFNLTINPVNDPPRLSDGGIEDREFEEDSGPWEIARLTEVFFDPDGDELTFTVEAEEPLEGSIDDENVLFLNLPEDVNADNLAVIITAEEHGGGLRETTEFRVTVQPVNDEPRVEGDGIEDQIVEEDTGPWEVADLDDVFMDVEDDNLEYLVDVPNPIEFELDENNILTLSAPLDFFGGDISVNITADEVDSDLSVELQFNLTITPVNDPPRLSGEGIPDIVVDEDTGPWDMGDLDDLFYDPDGDAIIYSVEAEEPIEVFVNEENILELTLPDNAFAENLQVTITAEEQGGGLQESLEFTITVLPVNDRPYIVGNGISDQVFDEDSGPWNIADLDEVIRDIEGDELEFILEVPDPISAEMNQNNLLTLTTPQDYNADDILISITANEVESELSVELEFRLTINAVNDPPRLFGEGIEDQNYIEDRGPWVVVDLDDVFFDPDEDVITYSVETTDPLEGTIDENHVLTLSMPDDAFAEDLVVIVTADEQGGGLLETTEFTVTVIPVNDPPRIVEGGIPDQVVDEDSGPWEITDLDDVFMDVEEDELEYLIDVPNPVEADLDENNNLTLSTPDDFNGNDLTVTITAGEVESNLSAEISFNLTINPVNDGPRLSGDGIEDLELVEDEGPWEIANLDEVFFDPDGDEMIYSFAAEEPLQGIIDEDNVLTLSLPDDAVIEDHPVTITAVEQGGGLEETTEFMVTVNPVNDQPRVVGEGIPDQEFNEDTGPWEIVDVDDIFIDPEGEGLVYSIELENNLSGRLDEDNLLIISSPPDFNGEDLLVTVVADEAEGELGIWNSFRITINPVNDPPRINDEGIPDQQFDEDSGEQIIADLDDIFFDPDGDELQFVAQADEPLDADIDENNVLLLNSPLDFNGENLQVAVTAIEAGANLDETDQFLVTVNPVNDAPRLVGDGIPDFEVDEDTGPWELLELDDFFLDPEDDELNYSVEIEAPLQAEILEDNTLNVTAPDDFFGDEIEIEITTEEAGGGLTIVDVFSLTILDVNDDPFILEEIPDQQFDEDTGPWEIADLDEVFADPERDQLEYSFVADEPLIVDFDEDVNILTLSAPENYFREDLVVSVAAVEPDEGLEVIDEFLITINPVNDAPEVINPIPDRNDLIEDEGPWEIADLSEVFDDVDDDDLFFTIEVNPENTLEPLIENTTLLLTARENFNGAGIEVTVIADDGHEEVAAIGFRIGQAAVFSDNAIRSRRVRSINASPLLPHRDLTAMDEFELTVQPVNDAPELNFPDQNDFEIREFEEFLLEISATDADFEFEGDQLTIEVTDWGGTMGRGADFEVDEETNSGWYHWVPSFVDAGEYRVQFRITDSAGEGGSWTANITVDNVNRRPRLENGLDDVEFNEDDPERLIADLNEVFRDPDNENDLEFWVEDAIGLMGWIEEGGLFYLQPERNWFGVSDVIVGVRDQYDAVSSDTITVTVNPINDAPLSFTILEPANEDTLVGVDSITFVWEQARDIEDDDVTYTMIINHANTNYRINDIPDSSVTITTDDLDFEIVEAVDIRWWIWAYDGEDSTRSDASFRLRIEPLDVNTEPEPLPGELTLGPVYPNPFNDQISIRYSLPVQGNVKLTVHNLTGRTIRKIENNTQQPGRYTAVWDGTDDSGDKVTSGLYLARLVTVDGIRVERLVLIR